MKHKYIQTKFRKSESDTTLSRYVSNNHNLKQSSGIQNCFEQETNVIIVDFPPPNLQSQKKKTTINDFLILSLLGRGAYARVVKAQLITSDKEYAIKIIDKKFLDKLGKQYEVHAEKTALMELSHPNIIKLFLTFQDANKIYFVLEYCSNRDLAQLMINYGILPTNLIKYYTAEIISALEHMHNKGIYHRDLKLENITISDTMHLKIIDFATMNKENKYFDTKTMKFIDYDENIILEKIRETESSSSSSDENKVRKKSTINLNQNFVGTANYVSPEVLTRNIKEIGPACDLWSLGIILYFLFTGKTPFQGKTEKVTFQNILNGHYTFDDNLLIPQDAKDIITKLLVKEPSKRLGRGERGFEEIKTHSFFADIDFKNLKHTDPPIDPRIFLSYRKYERLSASPTRTRGTDEVYRIKPTSNVNIKCSKFQNSSFGNVTNSMNQMDLNIKIRQKILLQGIIVISYIFRYISCSIALFININSLQSETVLKWKN